MYGRLDAQNYRLHTGVVSAALIQFMTILSTDESFFFFAGSVMRRLVMFVGVLVASNLNNRFCQASLRYSVNQTNIYTLKINMNKNRNLHTVQLDVLVIILSG